MVTRMQRYTVRRWLGCLLMCGILVTAVCSVSVVSAQGMCEGRRALDPRNARLKVLGIRVTGAAVSGRIKNDSGEAAVGAMVWVNYYTSRRGGLLGQQCIPIGDLGAGEERPFGVSPSVDILKAEAWDYAAEALSWK